jgi:flagellar biosynthesis/type III secretory pathway M-ring protein FliF/YscJ
VDVVAFDSLGSIATVGVFGPALILVGLVVYAVVRDRRRNPREDDEEPATPAPPAD